MADIAVIKGCLLASHFDPTEQPLPLEGRIAFRPRHYSKATEHGLQLPAIAEATLSEDGRFRVDLLVGDWSWEVDYNLYFRGTALRLSRFDIAPPVGESDFADLAPVAQPTPGNPVTRGEPGVGIESISVEEGALVFRLTDGTETRLEDFEREGPVGLPGPAGPTGPKGPKGEPGRDAPTPTLTIGHIGTGGVGARITGEAPNFILDLILPDGVSEQHMMDVVGEYFEVAEQSIRVISANQNNLQANVVKHVDAALGEVQRRMRTLEASAVKDTGWRDVTSEVAVSDTVARDESHGFKVYLRRTGNVVFLKFAGVHYSESGVIRNWLTLPEGFAPKFRHTFTMHGDNGHNAYALGIAGSELIMDVRAPRESWDEASWAVDSTFPRRLPGVAA